MADTSRRGFITGLIAFAVTAPAIVRAGSLMPVKQMIDTPAPQLYTFAHRLYYLANGDGIWEIGYGEFESSPLWRKL